METKRIHKLELLEWIATLQDEIIIEELMKWKEDHQTVSIAQYNRELNEAEAAISRGEYVEHHEAVKRLGSWREK
jgi:predicted transcriptional regulator